MGNSSRLGASMRAAPISVAALLLIGGACGRDPILERADELEDEERGNEAGRPGTPATPGPGQASEPPPGEGVAPPPGTATAPPPGTPSGPAGPGGDDQPRVVITGEVRLPDYEVGKVRLDVFDGDQKNLDGPRPSVVAVVELERPGAFSIEVPASAAQIWIGAFIDEDQNGRPGPQDPSGWYLGNPVATEGGASGIIIDLVRQPPPPQKGL